jgi:hypothetical protein
MSSNCRALVKAVQQLINKTPEEREKSIKLLTNLQCVECSQTANFDNITAGENVDVKLNQIMSCGIGNSGGEQMVSELKKFIEDEKKEILNYVNSKNQENNKEVNNKIDSNNVTLTTYVKKNTLYLIIFTILIFIVIMILIIMKILGI